MTDEENEETTLKNKLWSKTFSIPKRDILLYKQIVKKQHKNNVTNNYSLEGLRVSFYDGIDGALSFASKRFLHKTQTHRQY
jgi:hypothetical protein